MGFMKIVNKIIGSILKVVLFPIRPLISPILKLEEAMFKMSELMITILMMVPKLLSLFTIFTDPGKVIKDTIFGITTGFKLIIETIFDSTIGGIHKTSKNYLGKIGYEEPHEEKEECLTPRLIEVLLLVLCPPLAILVRKGISSIIIILVAFALTYMYYIPGLIYASLYIL